MLDAVNERVCMETRGSCGVCESFAARLLLATALAAPSAGQATERVSVDSSGGQGNDHSNAPSISADGRAVAFVSPATNLVGGDTNGAIDVFVHDRRSGTTERASVDSGGAEGNGHCSSPSLSSDGRYVAFSSDATNLVSGDTNAVGDIFVRDCRSGTTERVSVGLGAEANSSSSAPSLSADGRYVAFASYANNLVDEDTGWHSDIFVRDRLSGTTERVSVGQNGNQGNFTSSSASISADGRYVAFTSGASNLVTGDTNGSVDIFVRDCQSRTTERVSVDSLGTQGDDGCGGSSISADGRFVAFQSFATNLVDGDTNGWADIFVHDRASGTTERVSIDSSGAQGDGVSYAPSISADRYVAFVSRAGNLVGGDTNGSDDVFAHDCHDGTTERLSVGSLDLQGNNLSMFPSMSANGRCMAFQSVADNLVSGDTNEHVDVFVRSRQCAAATSSTFSGDGINADTVLPVNASLGAAWSAPLTLGHAHGTGGLVVLHVRTTTLDGPTVTSPVGGRLMEVLVGGPLLATLTGIHDGASGDVPPAVIPDQFALVGFAWAAQYIVVGGGHVDFSQAVSGIVGCE